MKNTRKRVVIFAVFFVVMAALLFAEISAYAWLSTSLSVGKATFHASELNVPEIEMWTCHKNEGNYEWHMTYEDTEATIHERDKDVGAIGTIETDGTNVTFTPGEFRLYFGNIDNLAQEQDNLPIYLRFKVTLLPNSRNTAVLNIRLPENYLKIYKVDKTDETNTTGILQIDSTDNEQMISKLNQKKEFDFLRVSGFQGKEGEAAYELDTTKHELPKGFDSLFETLEVKSEHDEYTVEIPCDNTTDEEATVYYYIKFNILTETLQKALNDTELKVNMPAYLIFDADVSLDVSTGLIK